MGKNLFNIKGAAALFTSLLVCSPFVVQAEWQDVGTVATINESIDTDNCEVRVEALHANAIEHIGMSGNIVYINDRQTLKFKIGSDQIALLLSGSEIPPFLNYFKSVSEPKSMVLHVETNSSNPTRLFLHGVASTGALVGYASNITDLVGNLTIQKKCEGPGPSSEISGLTAVASSEYSNYYNPSKGVDDDENSFWAAHWDDSNIEYTVSLGDSYSLDSGTIKWWAGYEGTVLTILTSSDGVTFDSELPASAISYNGTSTTISFEGINATHVKIRINQHNNFVPVLIEADFNGWDSE